MGTAGTTKGHSAAAGDRGGVRRPGGGERIASASGRRILRPGGDFESGAAGWKLSGGARVVDGNERFAITGTSDSHSLLLPQGSPAMCTGLLLPVVRYVSTGGTLLAFMRVEAVYKDPRGRERSIDLLPQGLPSKSWAPSLPALQLMGLLNVLTLDGLTSDIALRFTPTGTVFGSGTRRVDDI